MADCDIYYTNNECRVEFSGKIVPEYDEIQEVWVFTVLGVTLHDETRFVGQCTPSRDEITGHHHDHTWPQELEAEYVGDDAIPVEDVPLFSEYEMEEV